MITFLHNKHIFKTLLSLVQCVIHGDLFRGENHTCPLLSHKVSPLSLSPFGIPYQEMHEKFEVLKESILKKYVGIIENVIVKWSCDWQHEKRTTLKEFIKTLPLPPKKRLIPRDGEEFNKLEFHFCCINSCLNLGVRGGRTESFILAADSTADTQLYYKDASKLLQLIVKMLQKLT